MRGAVRSATPFALKDATSMSIVTQGAAGTLSDASSMGKVIAATSLPPTQLVVTQQKPGGVVGLPSLPPGYLLNGAFKGMHPYGTCFMML